VNIPYHVTELFPERENTESPDRLDDQELGGECYIPDEVMEKVLPKDETEVVLVSIEQGDGLADMIADTDHINFPYNIYEISQR